MPEQVSQRALQDHLLVMAEAVAAELLVRQLAQAAQAVVVTARHQEQQAMDQQTQAEAEAEAVAAEEMVVLAAQVLLFCVMQIHAQSALAQV
jgi:replicative DNA helicase